MALILNLETSTTVCSVSLAKDGIVISSRESFEDRSHASSLTVFIEEVLKEAKLSAQDIDAVAVSQGPGSYTGLRIGVSAAKGICYAINKPLIAVNTMQAMALMALEQNIDPQAMLCPMIDARRMEVYAQFFDNNAKEQREVQAEIIEETTYLQWLEKSPVYFFGNGADKCKEPIGSHANARFIENIYPSANFMASLSYDKFKAADFVDVAYFEPFYLKDFIATTPKKKVL